MLRAGVQDSSQKSRSHDMLSEELRQVGVLNLLYNLVTGIFQSFRIHSTVLFIHLDC